MIGLGASAGGLPPALLASFRQDLDAIRVNDNVLLEIRGPDARLADQGFDGQNHVGPNDRRFVLRNIGNIDAQAETVAE